ncbi:hypothetical protein WG906_02285 [Pedobacter sp. P351]|uniref:hypothetical protein n=1 Tax=Pedobacter superstes TaxID=3133441 RepID=UPI0030B384B5
MPEDNQTEHPVTDKNITIVSIMVFCFALYRLILVEGLPTAISKSIFHSGPQFIFYFVNFLLPFVAITLFWRIKKTGWILIAFYVIYSLSVNLILLSGEAIRSYYAAEKAVFHGFFLLLCALYGFVAYLLFKKSMRNSFNISSLLIFMVCAISIVFASVL